MEAMLLVVSILLIVIWGVIDRKSIRPLRAFTKIGIVTYLVALICFSAAEVITEAPANVYAVYAGAGFSVITILAIVNVITGGIATLNVSRATRTFFDTAAMAILFSILVALIQIAPTTASARSYLLLMDFALIAVMVVIAVIALLVIVMKILFGSEKEVTEDQNNSIDPQA
ncbi:hypothetical protein D1831_13555 [Lactiplantibacillus garii]|uniref:Uncharacterized protein n=1 Tax=Lactiplantibacillus garii TaxID=2306423 RepID=A0A3R8J529_9LACO|nr:hypothetical protein [Lactiplantibacillus garii]RRK09291.1 hypothetical protein D1831_13555 [Lactiplantibacillus garii]